MTVGERMRKLRKNLNMSQQELDDGAGINVQTVRSYESGKYEPRLENIHKVSRILMVTPEYLRYGNDDAQAEHEEQCEFCIMFRIYASNFKQIKFCPVCGKPIKKALTV